MKKALFFMLLAVLFAGTSCSKSNSEKDNFKEQIIGTWDATQAYVDGKWIDVTSSPKLRISATFKKDGTYYGQSDIFGTCNGTYKVDGKTIRTYVDGELYMTFSVLSLENDVADINISDGSDSVRIRFKKR